MKICMTTLGCPGWDLKKICERGREYGYQGVDFRGYLGTLDITLLPEFTTQAAYTRRQLFSAGLEVSGISSSIQICNPEALERNLAEARRTIQVAYSLNCKNVRVFGGGDLELYSRRELVEFGQKCMESILNLESATGLNWLLETHDLWVHSGDLRILLGGISHPAFGTLWDIGNTPILAGETPEQTFQAIGRYLRYTHIKDAVYEPSHPQAMKDGWRYVLPGNGQVPLTQAIRLLHKHGYDGWLMFEHEKRWHPELPEPEEAFPHFVKWIKSVMAGL